MPIVIIHGPQGSGKTRNSAAFLRRYGCRRVVDTWDGRTPLRQGDLALTHLDPPFRVRGARIVNITKAKLEANIR